MTPNLTLNRNNKQNTQTKKGRRQGGSKSTYSLKKALY